MFYLLKRRTTIINEKQGEQIRSFSNFILNLLCRKNIIYIEDMTRQIGLKSSNTFLNDKFLNGPLNYFFAFLKVAILDLKFIQNTNMYSGMLKSERPKSKQS